MKYFGQYQDEIYSDGLRGVVPKLPIDMATLEKKAIAAWADTRVSYFQGDAATSGRRTSTLRRSGSGGSSRG
jgi:lactate 2-monooxygenase